MNLCTRMKESGSDFAEKPLYFYTTSNYYAHSVPSSIPVYKVAEEGMGGTAFEENNVTDYETEVSQLYADIAAKRKDSKVSVIASNCGSGNLSSSVFSNFIEGTPLPEGKFLDMQDLVHALLSCTPLNKIPRGFKKNLYFIVKQNTQGDDSISLSKLYADEFSWVGCFETTEAFYGKKTGEFDRLVLKKGNYFLNSEKTPMNPQPTSDDILIVKRNYGSAQAPFSLQRRITLVTNVPSYMHSSISLTVCVEYVSDLEGSVDGEEFSNLPFPVQLPHKSALTCGVPLPEGNFLDIDTLLAALVSRDSLSYIPDGVKEDVYYICNDSSNLFCRKTGNLISNFDAFGPWSNSHSVIISFIVHEVGSYERCYAEDELYYRQKRVGNDMKYELYDPQPSSNSILEIYRSHASSVGLWRRITWVVRAPKVLCSVVPHTACVEYLRLFRQGPLMNKSDDDLVDRTACNEGAPLPGGKFLPPRSLLQALRSAKPVENIPERLKNNIYFIVGIEKVKDLLSDSDWYSGSEVTHEMFATVPESKSDVKIFKKRGFYYVKNGVPLLPQPTYDSILGIDRLTSTWRKSGACKRQITWITKVPSHLAPLPINLACVEYVVDTEACLESVDSLQLESGKVAHANKQKLVKSAVGQDITQPVSSPLMNESGSLLKDVLFPISDDVRHSFIHHVEYRKGEITSLILYKEEQLLNLCQFCCSDFHPSVLCVKTLFKNQAFNVTVLTYINYSVIHGPTGEHPVFIGPIFLHKDDDCLTYNVFLSHIKKKINEIHRQVRGGKRSPLVWGTDVVEALQQSLTKFPRSCRLVCSNDVECHVLQMVKDHFSKSSELVEKTVEVFVGSEGLCNSPNEKELRNQFRMAKLLGIVPPELLLQFEMKFFPILKRNFATYDHHPWIKRGWVNDSKGIMFELAKADSVISGFADMKNTNELGGGCNMLVKLVNDLYDYAQNQVNELFSALMDKSELLTLCDDFKMYKISRHLNSCLTEAQLFERFQNFLSGKKLKAKVGPMEKIGGENVNVNYITDPELVVQQKKKTPGKKADGYTSKKKTVLRSVGKSMNNRHRHELLRDEVKPDTCKRNTENSCEERPQLSQKRKRNSLTKELNTAMETHGALLGRCKERAKWPQNRLHEEGKSERRLGDDSHSPEALHVIDNVEVKELPLKIQRRNITDKTVKDNKSEVIQGHLVCEQYGQESVTPQKKIAEAGFGGSNCYRGLLFEKCAVKGGEVSENKSKKKNSSGPKLQKKSKSNGSLKKRKKSIVSGKLGGTYKIKSLKGQQRKLLKNNTGQFFRILGSNHSSIGRRQFTCLKKLQGNLQKRSRKSMGKQDQEGVEPYYSKSRKRKGSTDQHPVGNECQVVDGNSRKSCLFEEVKYTDRKTHCLKKVSVKLEYLPQETLRKLSEHGSLLV
ncbi:uncharacterized protein Pabp2 isoform X1 [Macrobrachium rosenbergii]|uniref:uncharacterized protein Pabp2 isoform X1 n=1 Tax=Macrobrachium rosenbergii TaxID=79674 RepID=UPI0034D7B0EC